MPGTYSRVLLHVVFSTKRRAPLIASEVRERLYPFIGGVVRDEGGALYAIGGVADHIHLLVRWKTDGSIADLMRHVKSRSSKWLHESFPSMSDFAWQVGYSVFSVSQSQSDAVKRYIARQEEHHRTRSFKDELLGLLRAHDVEFDARCLFD